MAEAGEAGLPLSAPLTFPEAMVARRQSHRSCPQTVETSLVHSKYEFVPEAPFSAQATVLPTYEAGAGLPSILWGCWWTPGRDAAHAPKRMVIPGRGFESSLVSVPSYPLPGINSLCVCSLAGQLPEGRALSMGSWHSAAQPLHDDVLNGWAPPSRPRGPGNQGKVNRSGPSRNSPGPVSNLLP